MEEKKKKTSTTKKVVKWVLGIFLVLIILLISAPFLFKDRIVKLIADSINKNINAELTYTDSDLSLFTNFPLAEITLDSVKVINKAPFEGDTLYFAKKLQLSMELTELLKKQGEAMELKSFSSKNGLVNIIINKDNVANYDIAKATTSTTENTAESSLALNINSYALENMDFLYTDETTLMNLKLDSINHTGKGNFAKEILDLDTKTTAKLSLDMEKINYISNVDVTLDAILAINLKELKYTFKENKGFINQLPIEFDGFIQVLDSTQLYDIRFKTPTSSFKNALALLPKQYSGNLAKIQTKGNFDLQGEIKGIYSKTSIPKINVSLASQNAMFKYSDLPKAVRNINLNAKVINDSGNSKDTYIAVDKLTFRIDEDVFSTNGKISNLTTNPNVNLNAKGKIIFPNIIYVQGSNFNTAKITLTEFDAKTGTSDLALTGTLDNFYGFLFNDENLEGNFKLNSNSLKVDDFLAKETTNNSENQNSETLKIPSFLDISLTANAKNVLYDNINLANVSGNLQIKDEAISLSNLKTNVFGGNIGLNGNVSTKGESPTFSMNLNLAELNIAQSFNDLDMLTSIAPIAKALEGKVNSTINLTGVLDENLSPKLNTITGDLLGQLLNTRFKGNSKMLSVLGERLSFLDPQKFNFDQITAKLNFNNGVVTVKPIPISYKDINLTIAGTHSFDKSVNYNINIDVPVKYLGNTVTSALQKLTPKDAAEIQSIPVTATVYGTFTNPNVTTNLQQATTNLLQTIVEKQKQSLLNTGKDKLNDLLNGNTKGDSTKNNNNTKNNIKNIIKVIFGKKKDSLKKKDSIN